MSLDDLFTTIVYLPIGTTELAEIVVPDFERKNTFTLEVRELEAQNTLEVQLHSTARRQVKSRNLSIQQILNMNQTY